MLLALAAACDFLQVLGPLWETVPSGCLLICPAATHGVGLKELETYAQGILPVACLDGAPGPGVLHEVPVACLDGAPWPGML